MEPPFLFDWINLKVTEQERTLDITSKVFSLPSVVCLASHLVLLSVAAAEDPVSAAGSQSRAVLRRVSAQCQPDWKWNRRCGIPREAPFGL